MLLDVNDFLKAANRLSCPSCNHWVRLEKLHYNDGGAVQWVEYSCNRDDCSISFSFSPEELERPELSMAILKRDFGHTFNDLDARVSPVHDLDAKIAAALEDA
jgi:hypothetical protein